MHKIAVLGDHDSIYGFAALGFDCVQAEDDEAAAKLKELVEEEYGIIYITEKLADKIEDSIRKYDGLMIPAIIRIPGNSGNTGKGVESVKSSVEKAVGSDILFSNKE